MSAKTSPGNFFEDFHVGQKIAHATPRTLAHGDAALYQALYGSRFALQSSDTFAQFCGLPRSPLDDLLVFHTVFGKSVPDISLNAVANLGYAEGKFLKAVYPGETLTVNSEILEEIPGVVLVAHASSSAVMASAMATVCRAISACSNSTIRPSCLIAPLPLFSGSSKAAISLRAASTSADEGANTALHGSIWLGWISVLPSKPKARACVHVALKPSAFWMSL